MPDTAGGSNGADQTPLAPAAACGAADATEQCDPLLDKLERLVNESPTREAQVQILVSSTMDCATVLAVAEHSMGCTVGCPRQAPALCSVTTQPRPRRAGTVLCSTTGYPCSHLRWGRSGAPHMTMRWLP